MRAPHGSWQSSTVVAGLTEREWIAPLVIEGAMNAKGVRDVGGEGADPETAAARDRSDGQPLRT